MNQTTADNAGRRHRFALLAFLQSEAAGGAILIVSAVVALAWANSAFGGLYRTILHVDLGGRPAEFWVNDGLMAIFFLLVGLELRREMSTGELASPAKLAAPALAALGGMIVPAVIYSAFNFRNVEVMRGWAVPVATDIAFALAVLSVLGKRVPIALKVFLTALAIIDDLGAIVVIALFYSRSLQLWALGGAFVVLGGLWGLNRLGVRSLVPFIIGGVLLWMLVLRSGVHATLSGVALAFVIPARARSPLGGPDRESSAGEIAALDNPAMRLEHFLSPWVSYLILPVFGFANAGLRFDALPKGVWRDPLTLGIAAALVLGKQAGVFGAVLLSVRTKLAALPAGVTILQIYGASILCGIGFTMSLFIGNLAFAGSPRENEVKLAVFVGSLISAALGLLVLSAASRRAAAASG